MAVQRFSIPDAAFERSPGQKADVFAGNLLDERHGGPVTVDYGRYGPNQSLKFTLAVHSAEAGSERNGEASLEMQRSGVRIAPAGAGVAAKEAHRQAARALSD